MKLNQLGEFEFIHRISEKFPLPKCSTTSREIIGIGDDCAVIPQSKNSSLLVTTDMLVENTHFITQQMAPKDLGYKSLAVNLSDIAAMGGIPRYAFLSLGLPPDLDVKWLDLFFTGFKQLSQKHHVTLLGGDTTRSTSSIIINVTLLGTANPQKIKWRSTARPGDLICVTGYIGDSGGGFKTLCDPIGSIKTTKSTQSLTRVHGSTFHQLLQRNVQYLLRRHFRPQPQIQQGQWLAQHTSVHAMMDISDGINSDLKRIMEQSKCGAKIHIEKLPLSRPLKNVCEHFHWDACEIAALSGEDYCLLVTVDPQKFETLSKKFSARFHQSLFPIGEITNTLGKLSYLLHGKHFHFKSKGFEHFPS